MALLRGVRVGCAVSLLALGVAGCASGPPVSSSGEEAPLADAPAPDSIEQAVEMSPQDSTYAVYDYHEGLERYHAAPRTYDLLHTTLDLAFDFFEERVTGTAMHELTPLANDLSVIPFDARGLDIETVTLTFAEGVVDTVRYDYDGADLLVYPTVNLLRADTVQVRIRYSVAPMREGERRGMVFIDGEGDDPELPTQVWTLGQPEDNQRWFPTWDQPNDFASYTLHLTVPEVFSTVANGTLTHQEDLGNGRRRDRWEFDGPHASYLTALAIGVFDETSEAYTSVGNQTIPLQYFFEPRHRAAAERVFGITPRLMAAFEEKTGMPYPWENYKQVPVHGFAAQGMENTTMSLFTHEVLQDRRAFQDHTYQDLLAHELAHQWFGNLVTTQDWANLALNEGLATYFEQVFTEVEEGAGPAQRHRIAWLERYFEEAERYRRPLVWYGYQDPNELFDAHTYEKAAMVLDYLRYQLGDEAFWQGIRTFLRNKRHQTASVVDLQQAMESASGWALHSFFDQWFRTPGHPQLEVIHQYDRRKRLYTVQIKQIHDRERTRVFDFQVDIELNFIAMAPFTQRMRVFTSDTTFVFTTSAPLSFARFDPGAHLPATTKISKPLIEWIEQARKDDEPEGRYEAVLALIKRNPSLEIRDELVIRMTEDPVAFVRRAAAGGLSKYATEPYVYQILQRVVDGDDHATVRSAALQSLAAAPRDQAVTALHRALQDSSYTVIKTSIELLAAKYPEQAVTSFLSLYDLESWNHTIEHALIDAIVVMQRDEGIPFLLMKLDPSAAASLKKASAQVLPDLVEDKQGFRLEATRRLLNLLDDPNSEVRLSAAHALTRLAEPANLDRLETQLHQETSPRIRQVLEATIARLQPPPPAPDTGNQ